MPEFKNYKNKLIPEHQAKRLEYIGMFIRNLRMNAGLSQKEMGLECGLSRNTIQKGENSGNMKLLTLFKIIDSDSNSMTLEQFFTEME